MVDDANRTTIGRSALAALVILGCAALGGWLGALLVNAGVIHG